MSTKEIANQLVTYCRKGEGLKAVEELYHDQVTSVEMKGWPMEIVNGIDNIKMKHERFAASVEEIHSNEVSDPLVADNFFSCTMSFDATFKGRGRSKVSELCVYEVKDGKVTRNSFFIRTKESLRE